MFLFAVANSSNLQPLESTINSTEEIRSAWFVGSMTAGTTKQLILQAVSISTARCAMLCLQHNDCGNFCFIENEKMCKLFSDIDDSQVTDLSGNLYFVEV